MKLFKRLTALFVVMFAFVTVLATTNVNAAVTKEYSYTFTESKFSGNSTVSLGDVKWTLAGEGGNYWGFDNQYGKGQQLGSSSKYYTSMTLTSESFSSVTSITINTSGASSTNAKFDVLVGGTPVGNTTSLTSTATEYTFSVDNLTGAICFSYSQTSAKAIYVKSIKVTYLEESDIAQLSAPNAVLDSENNKITLSAVENAEGYKVGIFKSVDAASAYVEFDAVEGENELPYLPQNTEYFVKVKAIADGTNYLSSEWSNSLGSYTNEKIKELSLSEFIELPVESVAPYTYYKVTGVVSNVVSTTYGNFDLVDVNDSNVSIYVYGLTAGERYNSTNDKSYASLGLKEGNVLTLAGYMSTYQGAKQIAGAFYVSHKADVKTAFSVESTKSSLNFKYSYTTSSEQISVTKDLTIAPASSTYLDSSNNENYASLLGLDAAMFNVTGEKGGSSNFPYLHYNKELRLYHGGGALNVENTSGLVIESIEGTTTGNSSYTGTISVYAYYEDGTMSEAKVGEIKAAATTTINLVADEEHGDVIGFKLINDSTVQARITALKISYAGEAEVKAYKVSSVDIRYGAMISAELYENLVAAGQEVKFGVAALKASTLEDAGKGLVDYIGTSNYYTCEPVRVNAEGVADENGEYYQFALVIQNVPMSDLDVEITAACYVEIDGEVTLMNETTQSVKSAANKYLEDSSFSEYGELFKYLVEYTQE